MKPIPTEVIAEIRSRTRILDVISEFVVLKRAGKDYKGLCPFHKEKSPSFIVHPDTEHFKCFGCHEGGDVFAFVQKIKRIGFAEAVRELAGRAGVVIPESSSERGEYDKRAQFLLLYQQTAEFFARLLQDGSEGKFARDYLHKRGLDEETIARFRLGVAPAGWDGLLRYLTEGGRVSPETLQEAGLARRKPDTNSFYDLFRNRLMVPIADEQGRVIAFGGRTLVDDQVKYINSPESLIYTKGEHLFALHQAKEAIKERDSVMVVEGYFDAITAHRHGFANTVAALGTALTERQARLLVRFTESRRVFLCFDTDAAGEKAVDRSMEILANVAEGIGMNVRVVQVPGGKDPDECLRSAGPDGGVEAFTKAYNEALPLLDYQLEKNVLQVDLTSHTGRIEAAKHIVPILGAITSAVTRGEYVRQWSGRLGIREEDLLSEVGRERRGRRAAQPPKPAARALKAGPRPGFMEAEIQLLAVYLLAAQDYELARDRLRDETMIDPVHQRIKEAMEGIGNFSTSEDFWQTLQDRLASDLDANSRLSDLSSKVEELRRQNLPTEVILKDAGTRLFQERLNQVTNALWAKMQAGPGEEEEVRLQSKIMQLKRLQNSFASVTGTDEDLVEAKRKLEALLVEAPL